ncbi:ack2 protein [Lactobacillus selangorensis]|uniref:Acetate kinase n=2 Tax=Lactobacillus selangorensis TaxID=81857 RepID=A0A0R2FYE4_9LACO|nr:ack2 protein [Lactobacillus selangorensis]KRN30316.1 ack2 protein [Lactobacillus selangorensis]
MDTKTKLAKGMVDRMGMPGSTFSMTYGDQPKYKQDIKIESHDAAAKFILDKLKEFKVIGADDEIKGIGHRVVSGGNIFTDSTLVDQHVLDQIRSLGDYAPLHNPAEADGIAAFMKLLPGVPEVAVFDTTFHRTMPPVNYLYSIPYEYYEKYGVRKYGAHGTSYRYLSKRAGEILNKPLKDLKIIAMHLGSGASMCAIEDGKSLDTSMGFTPLAGITMATRSGDIDASLVAFLKKKLNVSTDEIVDMLNHKSGILGISGLSPDMRDLEKTRFTRDRSQLAIDIFTNRIVKYFGSYAAIMHGVTTLVFAGGIGEGDPVMRKRICDQLDYFGVKIDAKQNDEEGIERIISTPDSKVTVMVIPTNEEIVIAEDVVKLIKK